MLRPHAEAHTSGHLAWRGQTSLTWLLPQGDTWEAGSGDRVAGARRGRRGDLEEGDGGIPSLNMTKCTLRLASLSRIMVLPVRFWGGGHGHGEAKRGHRVAISLLWPGPVLISCPINHIGPVRFAEKTNRNTVPADLLWEKNTVLTEKQAEKDGL